MDTGVVVCPEQAIYLSHELAQRREARRVPEIDLEFVIEALLVPVLPRTPVYAAVAAAREKLGTMDAIQLWAPRVGLEPTTNSLTASRSTIELPRNVFLYELSTTIRF